MQDAPAPVSILRQGAYLLASIRAELDDRQMLAFRQDLVEAIGSHMARGVVIDVAALDVLDSFGSRTVRDIAEISRLRGAATVIVGIQPEVAAAMVRLGMGTGTIPAALDLEDGLELLDNSTHLVGGCPVREMHRPSAPAAEALGA